MTVGTAMAAWAMLAGKASVLYTFYPPLKGHPLFYLGTGFINCWLMDTLIRLGKALPPMEKRKPNYKNTTGCPGNTGKFHYLVCVYVGCCV
jgi:cytochrome c oxidase subunit 1